MNSSRVIQPIRGQTRQEIGNKCPNAGLHGQKSLVNMPLKNKKKHMKMFYQPMKENIKHPIIYKNSPRFSKHFPGKPIQPNRHQNIPMYVN